MYREAVRLPFSAAVCADVLAQREETGTAPHVSGLPAPPDPRELLFFTFIY